MASGGWATPVAFETALIAELVSRGWMLVAFDHPHDTVRVEQPNGEVIRGELEAAEAFLERVPDVGVVLTHSARSRSRRTLPPKAAPKLDVIRDHQPMAAPRARQLSDAALSSPGRAR